MNRSVKNSSALLMLVSGRRALRRALAGSALAAIAVISPAGTADDGDLFVANLKADSISRFDGTTGAFKGVFVQAEASGLQAPTGLDFGPDGHLYVSSSGNHRVLRFDGETGRPLGIFIDGGELHGPFSLIFGPDGHLYVSSGSKNVVLRYDGSTGKLLNVAASAEDLKQPIGLGFGPDGDLYVVNSVGKNVLRFEPETGEIKGVFASGDLGFPSDLAFGPDGLYVSDASKAIIVRFDARTGERRDVFGRLPEGSAPMGLAFGMDGRLYVGDFAKGRLFRFETGGAATLLSSEGLWGPENITIKR